MGFPHLLDLPMVVLTFNCERCVGQLAVRGETRSGGEGCIAHVDNPVQR